MARTRLNPSLAKIHITYTVDEIARLFAVHRNTVRAWIKHHGLQPIDGGRPILVKGDALRAFVEERRRKAKRPCSPGHLYCFGCHAPRKPALGMADFVVGAYGAGRLSALCETCGTAMHRRAVRTALASILPDAEVRIVKAEPHLKEPSLPSSTCDLERLES